MDSSKYTVYTIDGPLISGKYKNDTEVDYLGELVAYLERSTGQKIKVFRESVNPTICALYTEGPARYAKHWISVRTNILLKTYSNAMDYLAEHGGAVLIEKSFYGDLAISKRDVFMKRLHRKYLDVQVEEYHQLQKLKVKRAFFIDAPTDQIKIDDPTCLSYLTKDDVDKLTVSYEIYKDSADWEYLKVDPKTLKLQLPED